MSGALKDMETDTELLEKQLHKTIQIDCGLSVK
jgi:hypothetical protein